MAPQAAGREPIPHRHQAAARAAHQRPLPGVPLAALEAVVERRDPRRAGPGVIALGGADEAVGAAPRPGQQQGQQIPHRKDGITPLAPAAHKAPLAQGQTEHPRPEIRQQAPQALVAKATAGQLAARTHPAQQPLLFRPAIGRTVSHHWQHRHFDVGAALLQGLDHPQGNQVFPMAVAQDQQAARHPVTDTIRPWEFAPKRRHGQVVRQRIANPLPPVRIWVPPFNPVQR